MYWKSKINEKLLLLHFDIVTAATNQSHCLIVAEAAGPPLIPIPEHQALALPVPPTWGYVHVLLV